jgi:hypothetical protein
MGPGVTSDVVTSFGPDLTAEVSAMLALEVYVYMQHLGTYLLVRPAVSAGTSSVTACGPHCCRMCAA